MLYLKHMIKISKVVEEMLRENDVAKEALKHNYLNMSAYAKTIQKNIASRLYKPVSVAAIVVALSRLQQTLAREPDYYPKVHIEDLSLRANLSEITYEKTKEAVIAATKLNTLLIDPEAFFAITQGSHELTIICDSAHIDKIIPQFPAEPKGQYDDLTAITVRFIESDYIEVPNMIFTLIAALAVQRINLIEIVSTFTELSFVVRSHDAQRTISALSQFFIRKMNA